LGKCSARRNGGDALTSLVYGRISSAAIDPIEKKPLYHFYPGEKIFSIGFSGCNLKCPFCQNFSISQSFLPDTPYVELQELLYKQSTTSTSMIAYTYSEPLIAYEYVLDLAQNFREQGIKNVLVTNAYINSKPFKEMLNFIDALNIDLKTFTEDGYRRLDGSLEPVKNSIEAALSSGCHVEITVLAVPTISDSLDMMNEISQYIASLNKSIPLHISRYFPAYKFNEPSIEIEQLNKLYECASKNLDYVYLGNVYSEKQSNTYCPKCGEVLIIRKNYNINITDNLIGNVCAKCGSKQNIVV
jgi:pyruvate formate lyase activating enzyme